MYVADGKRLTSAGARKVADTALERAREAGIAVTVAVVSAPSATQCAPDSTAISVVVVAAAAVSCAWPMDGISALAARQSMAHCRAVSRFTPAISGIEPFDIRPPSSCATGAAEDRPAPVTPDVR